MKSLVLIAIILLLAIATIAGCGNGTPASKVDTDGDGVADELEVAGYYWKDGKFVKWDGDPSIVYYRTDPTQFSTDQDPLWGRHGSVRGQDGHFRCRARESSPCTSLS